MLDEEEQDAVLQLIAQEEQTEALNYSEECDLNLQMAEMMLLHFCHSPLKVVFISAISVEINLANSQNRNLPNSSLKIRPKLFLTK